MKTKGRIAYYITPHGFGHAVRSLEVVRHIVDRAPEVEVTVVSHVPDFLVNRYLRGRAATYRRRRLDVGLVQLDSVRFDLDASLHELEALHANHDSIVSQEAAFLQEIHASGVVSDIPFLALYAAERCGLPSVGLSNFSWDWIYRAYAESDDSWKPIIQWIEEGYRRCGLFLQLPMHGDCSVFPRMEEVPLVAHRATVDREEARGLLGCGENHKAYLVSFGSLELDTAALGRIQKIEGALFYAGHPLNLPIRNGRSIDGLQLDYVDIVNAVDAVITKPGYGILADCLAHGIPMIYSDRGCFPEYEVLVNTIEAELTSVYMPSQDLYTGDWEAAIRHMESLPRRIPRVRDDGAEVCARRILREFNLEDQEVGNP